MSEALQVLIVEDSENDAELLLLQLRRDGFDPQWKRVETAKEMTAALRAQRWDAIVSDYSLPSFSAPAALDLLKKSGHDIPFIVVSGTVGEEVAVETMKAGAHDYLPKAKLTRLGEALRREIREAEVRRSERAGVERIEHLNRVLRAIRNVNQLIVREKEPKSLIQQACDLLVETRGYRSAWIALVSDGERAGHLASSGWGDAFEAFAQRVRSRLEPPCWPKACADRQRLVALDPRTECVDCPLRAAYAGGNAMVSALVHGEKLLGFMGISTQPGLAINEEERSLVLEASGDLAFALDAIGREKERREATERFRVSFEKASIGKALTSCDGHFLRVNDAFARMLGFSSAELEGKSFNDVTHPDDRAAGSNAIDGLMAGKEAIRFEKRYVARDGATVWVDVNVALVRESEGQPQYFIGSFVDITERKRAEFELRRSEARYRTVFENAIMGISQALPDGRLVNANQAYAAMYGYSNPAEMMAAVPDVGQLYANLDDRQEVLRALSERGVMEPREVSIVRRDGSQLVVLVSARAIRDSAGALVCYQAEHVDVTARRRAEEKLEFREIILATQQEASPDGILVVDVGGKIISSNRRFADLWGIPPGIIESKSDDRALQSVMDKLENPEEFISKVKHLYAYPDESSTDEISLKDGRTFDRNSAPMIGADGRLLGRVWYFRDITARQRSQEELRASLQLIEGIINAIPARVFWKDRSLRYLGCNAIFARDAGFADPRDLIGKDDDQMGWRDHAESYRRDDRQVIASGSSRLLVEESQRTPTGNIITLLTSKVPLRSSSGEVVGVLGTYVDITDRKRAEADRERLTTAIEQAAEIVLVTDAQGSIAYVNPAFESVTGYTRADVLGRNPRLLKSGVQDAACYRTLWETISGGKTWHGRLVNKKRDGTLYTEDATISPVRDATGGITSYVAVKRDVTHELSLEMQLLQSQKMEAIGSLAGGVAHDFNNLLSVILSYTEFAMEAVPEGSDLKSDLLEVKSSAKRAVALTRQLLAFSRKQMLQPVPLSLNQAAAGIEKMLRRILGEDIDLVQVLAPDLGMALADPGQIDQVLMNLVVNARDAMPTGGKLTIETSNVEIDEEYAARHVAVKPGSFVQLAVTDTGCGMDEQTKAMIFEPFFTTKGQGKGTGLGLSTVYGIVKQSGGNIWVYSELGRGTTFKIYLPRELSATQAMAPAVPPVPRRSTGTETVLLVEDEEALRKVARRSLVAAGYIVLTAANGDEALSICAQHGGDIIDLLLTDVVMPRMSGRTLAQELSKTRPTLKVLYMSGYTDNAIVHHGVLDAGTHFLGKPFTSTELARKVREVLDGGATTSSGDPGPAMQAEAEIEEQSLDVEALREIPNDVLEKLRKAVIAARYGEIVELVEAIRLTKPKVASVLRRMADTFDYDAMRVILKPVAGVRNDR